MVTLRVGTGNASRPESSPHHPAHGSTGSARDQHLIDKSQTTSPRTQNGTHVSESRQSTVWMILPFILGIVFAVSHHFYYNSLAGTKVENTADQQWPVRSGTVLAFLTKALLAATVAAAHTHYVWTMMRSKSASFTDWKMISRAKVPTLLTVTTWALLLSALMSPAALSVSLGRDMSRIETLDVPSLNFNAVTKFAVLGTCHPWTCALPENTDFMTSVWFRYPGMLINKLAVATASTGSILPATPTHPSSTYNLTFYGPSMKCEPATDFESLALHAFKNTTELKCNNAMGLVGAYYYAMVPGRTSDGQYYAADLNDLPQVYTDRGNQRPYASELWVTTSHTETENAERGGCRGRGDWKDSTCALYNTSYSVEFAYLNGVQSTKVHDLKYLDRMPYMPSTGRDEWGYGDMIDAAWAPLSYQAVWLALVEQLVGRLELHPSGTKILQTPVVGSSDLVDYWDSQGLGVYLPSEIRSSSRNKAVEAIIEELSRNVTLSLFSASSLWPNVSAKADVTIFSMSDYYVYNRHNLLVYYASAFFIAIFVVVIGIVSLQHNSVSYDASLSSVLLNPRTYDLDPDHPKSGHVDERDMKKME